MNHEKFHSVLNVLKKTGSNHVPMAHVRWLGTSIYINRTGMALWSVVYSCMGYLFKNRPESETFWTSTCFVKVKYWSNVFKVCRLAIEFMCMDQVVTRKMKPFLFKEFYFGLKSNYWLHFITRFGGLFNFVWNIHVFVVRSIVCSIRDKCAQ